MSITFEEFAQSHGLIIDRLEMNLWTRVSTEDKPSKKNGAYIWDGQSGAVQNWAIHEKPISFKSKSYDPFRQVDREKINKTREDNQAKAKSKAVFMMNNAVDMTHLYLARKGFPSMKALVWNNLLLIPMRIEGKLVGCQMIDKEGNKKFLKGQITKGASLVIDNKGRDILVEGYATGLSVREALKQAKKRYTIHVCFSAGNMLEIAKGKHDPLVIADNDLIGINTAHKIGQYWVSKIEKEDFNDSFLRGDIGNLLDLI
jgi:putative DNA primase/helicase